ncbi:unnamed protein product [Cochlearia groenlandica]
MKAKKRKVDNGSASSNSVSQPQEEHATRPEGVKVAKARGKQIVQNEPSSQYLSTFQDMWTIKDKDHAKRERLYKMSMLDNLIAKKEPLDEIEITLKKKLISDMFS